MELKPGQRLREIGAIICSQWQLCTIVILTIVAYLGSFGGQMLLDDSRFICRIAEFDSVQRFFETDRPFLLGTFGIQYALSGFDLFSFHCVNLLIHVAAACVLFLLLRRIVGLNHSSSRIANSIAFSVALLWALHPLQTQAVTYIVQRGESMMVLFLLLCLYFTYRASRFEQPTFWQLAVVGCCWAGMFSKGVMVVAPLLIILFDRIYLADSWKQVFKRRALMHLGIVATAVSLFMHLAQRSQKMLEHGVGGSDTTSSLNYLLSQSGVLVHYIKLSIWPNPLCLDYGWPVIETWRDVVPAGLAIVALLAIVAVLLAKKPKIGFVGFVFFLVLGPTSSIIPIRDLAVEHRMYLPLASIIILVVLGLSYVLNRMVKNEQMAANLLVGLCILIALPCGVATYIRNTEYQEPIKIWRGVAEVAPWNRRAVHNYGFLLMEDKQYSKAVQVFKSAKERTTTDFGERIHHKLGIAYRHLKKYDLAEKEFMASIQRHPDFEFSHYDLGLTYVDQQRYDEAITKFTDALLCEPTHHDSRKELAKIHEQRGDLKAAELVFISATEIHFKNSLSFERLANFYARHGEYAKAAPLYDRALGLSPELVDNHIKGAICYERSGDSVSAIRVLRAASTRFPAHIAIKNELSRLEKARAPQLSAR
jgi:tetratricopeptide (TPR) repeat protein